MSLRGENLIKSYLGRRVVDGVNIEVSPGEVVGLLGPNGAGKTTSFYMFVGLVRPDSGSVFLEDIEITDQPMYIRAQQGIAYLPQEASAFRRMTVFENILAIVEMLPEFRGDRRKQVKKVVDLIEELNLGKVRDSKAASLSGGERRRVEIARALACSPKYMLLDEPFAGIDPLVVRDLQSLVTTMKQKGIGILITDHNVRETLGICDRAYILAQGNVIESGNPDRIATSEKARRFYLGDEFRL
jgi:lipopolysaccharide export system ATP-binding protein